MNKITATTTISILLLLILPLQVFAAPTVSTNKDTYIYGDPLNVSGTGATASSPVTINVLNPSGTLVQRRSTTANAAGAYSLDNVMTFPSPTLPAHLPLGTYTVQVIDGAGNKAEKTVAFAVLDTTAPTISSVSVDMGAAKSGASITVTVKATDATGVTSVKVDTTSLTMTAGTALDGTWTGTITAAATEGTQTLTVEASDAAGNKKSATTTYIVDNTAPTIASVTPTDGSKVFKAELTVSGTVTDNVAVASVTVSGSAVTVAANGAFTTTKTLALGANTITIVATDTAGNSKTETRSVTYATSPPLTITVETGKTYVAGDKITIFVQFTSEGELVDPTIAVKHVHSAAGTVDLPTLSKIHAGWYKVDYTAPSQAGDYAVHIQALYESTRANGQSVFTVTSSLATAAAVSDAANTLSNKIDTAADRTVSRVNSQVTTSENNVKSAVSDLKSAISASEGSIKSAISASEANIQSAVTSAANDVKSAVTSAANDIKGAVTSAENSIKSAVNDVKTAVTTAESNIKKDIATVNTAIGAIPTRLGEAQNLIIAAINTARDDVKKTATDSNSAVSKEVTDAKNTVNALKSDLDSINTGVGQTSTFVLVVGIIAAIALVVQLAILMRKK